MQTLLPRPRGRIRRSGVIAASIGIVCVAAGSVATQAQTAAPNEVPGWTGTTHPNEIVAARRAVMLELERLIRPLDSHAVGEPGDPDALREAAGTISTLLLTVPHLFPPSTDLYDPNEEIPSTLARPEIWQDFASFYALAEASAYAAADTLTMGAADLPKAAAHLRETCDACHAGFMRTYTLPAATEEDLEFDFDSIFPLP